MVPMIYEYKCDECGEMEIEHKDSEPKKTKCPKCGREGLRRLVSAGFFQLKGSGWFEDGY